MTARAFNQFLAEQRNGQTHAELSDALNELVAAVEEQGKAGELVLRIKVKPAGKVAAGTVIVEDEIKMKPPAGERSASIFFVTSDNNLSRKDPYQQELLLKDINEPKEAAK